MRTKVYNDENDKYFSYKSKINSSIMQNNAENESLTGWKIYKNRNIIYQVR